MHIRFLTLVASLVLAPIAITNAQVSGGDIVRIITVDEETVIGTVAEVTSNGVGLAFPQGGLQYFSYGDMESFHKSLGRKSYRKQFALVGTGVGALMGVALGVAVSDAVGDSGIGFFAGVAGAAAWGGMGALTGVILGSFFKGENWQEVVIPGMDPVSFEPRIGFMPQGNPVIGIQISF